MRTTFLRAQTSDNLLLQGLLYEPEGPARAAVLHVHGMAGNFYENRFLDVFADVYTRAGLALLTVNPRGHDTIADFPLAGGGSRRVGSAYERFADCALDLEAWATVLRERGFGRIIVQGHSLGASKVVHYLTSQ